MVVGSYYNRDREDEEDDYGGLSDREKRILDFPPPPAPNSRYNGAMWKGMQQEYAMACMRKREIQRKNHFKMIERLHKKPSLIKQSEINQNNYDGEDRDEDFDENGVRRNLKDFLSR